MTWTLAGTTNNTNENVEACWKEIFTSYLNTRVGWSCTQSPNNTTDTDISYTFQNLHTNESHTYHSFYRDSTHSVYRNNLTYTTVQGDNNSTLPNTRTTLQKPTWTVGNVFRIWNSTENDRTMLVTYGKQIVMYAPGPSEIWVVGKSQSEWAPGTIEDSGYWYGMDFKNGGELWCYPRYDPSHTGSTDQQQVLFMGWHGPSSRQGNAILLKQPTWYYGSRNSSGYLYLTSWSQPMHQTTNNDVLIELTDNATYPVLMPINDSSRSVSAVVKSGNNYYLRPNSNLELDSALFDMGTSLPSFSVQG